MRTDFLKTLLLVLVLYFACDSSHLSASDWPPAPEVSDRIDAARNMLTELVNAMPADLSDTEKLADTLDYEIEVAHRFVRDQIQFEPYLGVLKGPQGTAATLAGNAWDQAVLLTNLINIMGGEAQLVTGSIDSESVRMLLNQAFVASKQNQSTADVSVLLPILTKYSPELATRFKQHLSQDTSAKGKEDLSRDTRRLSDLLLKLFDMDTTDQSSLERLTEKLSSSYAWVRWRDGPSDEWQALHPAFAEGQLPVTTESGVFSGAVPEEYQHRLKITMQIERQVSAGKFEREAVMNVYTRPTAQLFKQDLVIGMGPPPGPPGKSKDAAFILPYLNGALAPGAKAVNAIGLTADAAAALQGGAGDLFARLSSTMGSAIGALGGAGTEEGSETKGPLLTSILLKFELQGPGFEPRVAERRLVDNRNNHTSDFPVAFAFNSVVKVSIGSDTGTRVARQFIAQESAIIDALPALMGVARGQLPIKEASKLPEYRSLPNATWLDADIVSGALNTTDINAVTFRPTAFVMARHTRTDNAGLPFTYSDVIFNPALALHRNANKVISVNPVSVLEQGVRETLIESKIMRTNGGWSDRTPVSVLAGIDELSAYVTKAGWSSAAQEMAARDINNGFKLAVTNIPEHWWRVDTKTGSTLGMGALGGQEFTEYLVPLIGVAMSTYFFYLSVESCDETYPDDQEMADCCIVGNLAVTYGSAGLGAAAGATDVVEGAGKAFKNMWASASGYITAIVEREVAINLLVGAGTGGPIDSACRAYLDK